MDNVTPPDSASPTILLIDDETELLEVNSKMLSALGYQIRIASSGQAGLDALDAGGADLVILDMLMPEMDGVETLRRIRNSHPDQKVVILSAFAEPEQVAAVKELGVLAYLKKPLALRNMATTIKDALKGVQSELNHD